MRSVENFLIMYMNENKDLEERMKIFNKAKMLDANLVIFRDMVDENPNIYLDKFTLTFVTIILSIASFGDM